MEKYRHHHILFSKRLWRVQDPTRDLRETQWLKPPMYDEEHAALHEIVSSVPVPDWNMGQFILCHFEPVQGNYFKTVDNLLLSIESVARNPRSDSVQRTLGQLMVHAIDLQRPFVQEGLVYERTPESV